jgi:ectoine hydroxylase-related dioxygenase (phytanoyl-CoA dioxygenase family)
MAKLIKPELTEGQGYIILEKIIPDSLIDSVVSKLSTLYPVRASSANKKYAERDDIKNLPDISVWWSQMVMDWPDVKEINDILITKVADYLDNPVWYASDIVSINSQSSWVNPHVDTPHRFKKYNYDKRLLGVQAICSLFDLDRTNGVTGVVPKSQQMDFNINLCYQGFYNSWFQKNCIQQPLPKGSVLFYNCRILHSSMPNSRNTPREALLFNYLTRSIIEDVKSLDNIWKSNE